MNITIATSGGTKRAVFLAKKFDGAGFLERLYIPFYAPKNRFLSKVFKWRAGLTFISVNRTTTNSILFILQRMCARAHLHFQTRYLFAELFDRYVARHLAKGADILFVESLIALHTMRKAKKLGMITILDRTNSHIQYQTDILKEEYEKLGLRFVFNSPTVIQKSLKEYEEADYIAVLSTFVKRTFLAKGIPERKLLLLPSGINLSIFQQVSKEDTVFRIIYCGLTCVKKGTHYLLEAFEQLSLPNAELWLIGGILDDIKPILIKYQGFYRSINYVAHSELYKYFSQGSVFVLPSLEEGLAKVIIEAMACGLPVIATTNTGAEDVVREGQDGFVIPIRDVDALKEKILFLYNNRNICEQMGQSAKERVKKNFSDDAYAKRIISAFNMVLNRRV